MESFVTSVALIGIVIVIASLLSGAIERSGFPLVAIFLLLGVAIGPWGFGIADVGFQSPALHALAMLGLALLLFSDAVTLDTKQLRIRARMLWRLLGPGTLVPATITALTAWILLGLFGHDPWKPDDATTFGVAHDVLSNGDCVLCNVDWRRTVKAAT